MNKWFQAGLAFGCSQCGRCCGGSPGVVWVDDQEIQRIAARLERSADALFGPVLRRLDRRVSLIERANGDCVFLRRLPDRSVACSIYDIRPQQCRTWPFWNENLSSQTRWDRAAAGCPGMNRGRLYSADEVETICVSPPWHERGET